MTMRPAPRIPGARRLPALFMLALAALLISAGCGWMKETTYLPDEAEAKLAVFCKKEGRLDVTTRRAGTTLWIYVPLNEPLFGIKPVDPDDDAKKKPAHFYLLYLDTAYNETKNFAVTYDMVTDVLPSDPMAYGSSYNEAFARARQLVYQGIQETLTNVTSGKPEFIAVVIADITTGVGLKTVVNFADLIQYFADALPPDEYYFREINAIIGDKRLAGDRKGRFLNATPVTWTWFLAEQLKSRLRYKFSQSKLPPDTDPDRLIAVTAANTFRFYPFKDYTGLYVHDLRGKRELLFDRKQLAEFEEMPGKNFTTISVNMNDILSTQKPAQQNRGQQP